MIDKIDDKHTVVPEVTWVPDDGIGIPCIYILYGTKFHKSHV